LSTATNEAQVARPVGVAAPFCIALHSRDEAAAVAAAGATTSSPFLCNFECHSLSARTRCSGSAFGGTDLVIQRMSVSSGCDANSREVALKNAKPGDLLVKADGSRVKLVKVFTPGIANGLYRGVVKITSDAGDSKKKMYEVTAICSIKGEPGWPAYDNIYGDPISDLNAKRPLSFKNRWQFLFHFDGRTEQTGTLNSSGWVSRLKDNLCRKGDFKDN
jgi:hypothetical protein